MKLTRENYAAEARLVNFAGNPESARQQINGWVAKKTQDKIPELLAPGQVTGLTRLVLCNAIYFKGKWLKQFDPKATQLQPFFVGGTRPVNTPLMSQETRVKSHVTPELSIIALPYTGDNLSLVILLPKANEGLPALEQRMTAAALGEWLTALDTAREVQAQVFLPKFKLNLRLELTKTLADMGMGKAFSDQADFSGMSARGDLNISDVIHQAFVDVNEEGTEAAAATGVGMRTTSVMRTQVFRVDHPFIFLIRENSTGSVLFLGRVMDPGGSEGVTK